MLKKIFGLILLLALFAPGQFSKPVYAQEEAPQLTILIEDDFDAPELWDVVSEEHYSTRYAAGTYEIANHLPGSFASSVRNVGLNHVLVETTANIEGADGAFGVTCRWQNADNFYAALVGDDWISLVRVQNGSASILSEQAWDSNMPARVGLLCTGPALHLLMNGEIVLSANDTAFAGGSAGMVVQAGVSDGVSVRFENFLLAEVEPDLTETPVEFYPGIRPGERLYLVRPGDTLQEIADRFHLSVPVLMQRNPHILDPELVYVWQPLAIPGGAAFPPPIETAEVVMIPETGGQPPFLIHTDLHPNVGVPILHGEFENQAVWVSGDEAETETDEGVYRITNASSTASTTSVRPLDLPLVHVEVEVQPVTGSASGLVCRWQDDSRYYAFVLNDGQPQIFLVQDGVERLLVQAEVDFDNESWRRIGANCDGSLLTMYVDGAAVLQAADMTYASGYFGLVVGPGAAAEFRELTTYLPGSTLEEE